MRRGVIAAVLLAAAARAEAGGMGLRRFETHARVRAVRAVDADGDGRLDLVLLVEAPRADGPSSTEVRVLRTPPTPDPETFFREADVVRIPCDGPAAGTRATAGAVALVRRPGRPGIVLRFLGRDVEDVEPDGKEVARSRGPLRTLLERSPGAPLVFWDGVADLDHDGADECWYPDAGGRVVLSHVDLRVSEEGGRGPADLALRRTHVPSLVPADVDGDGKMELVHLDGTTLVVERLFAPDRKAAPPTRVALPFLAPDPAQPPEEIRTPRLSLADVDGDGKVDLLVTVVQGRADKVGGLRTSLYHFAGPFVDPATGALGKPRSRIDTESVALHPRFVDVTGDGRLDYVADSIRGTVLDLIQRVMGKEPEITYTIFRFDPATGTFETAPFTTFERPYSGAQARGNTFGRSGYFEGDFDGDGVRDMLDLGNLKSIAILRGGKGEDAFRTPLMKPVPVEKDATLAADAIVADLDGDGRADAVAWTEEDLYVVASKGAP